MDKQAGEKRGDELK